jgi:hypothetical protein
MYGVNFGIGDKLHLHTDENTIISVVNNIIQNKDGNPHFFDYPSFYIYLQAFLFVVTKSFINLQNIDFYIVGRMFTAILGGLSVLMIYLISKKMFNRKVGVYSSLFLTFNFLHVHMSHYITTDLPMMFFCLLSFYFSLNVFLSGKLKDYIFAGFFAGISCATKYNFVVMTCPFIAHILYNWNNKFHWYKYINFKLFVSMLFVFIGFLLGCPYSVLDLSSFLKAFMEMANQVRFGVSFIGANDTNLVPSWIWYIDYLWKIGLWYPMSVVFVGGVIIVLINLDKKNIFLCSFPILYFIQIAIGSCRFDRYALPLIPFFSIFAGLFIWYAVEFINKRNWRRKNIVYFAGIVVFFVLPAFRCGAMDYYLSKRDTRALMTDWIINNVPKESKILSVCNTSNLGMLSERGYDVTYTGGLDFEPEQYMWKGFKYIVVSSEAFRIYDNYSKSGYYNRHRRNYQELIELTKLIKEINYSGFNWWFSNSFKLQNSSSLTVFHNPTIRIYKLEDDGNSSKGIFRVQYRAKDLMRWSSGRIVKDIDSSDNEAVYNGSTNGPYETYYKGDYVARYRVKVDDNARKDVIFGLSIWTAGRGKMLVNKEIHGTDFVSKGIYQDFDLAFNLDGSYSLEILVDYDKKCNLWIECIEIVGEKQ